jgi:cyclin G-associated kinase
MRELGKTHNFSEYARTFSDGTLVDLVSPKSIVLSPEIVCKLFYQVCLAVKHLHQQSPPVIHRDLKVRDSRTVA